MHWQIFGSGTAAILWLGTKEAALDAHQRPKHLFRLID
jgi:hypothetical protein